MVCNGRDRLTMSESGLCDPDMVIAIFWSGPASSQAVKR